MKLGSFHSDNKISLFQEKYLLTLNFLACKHKLSELKKYENIIKKNMPVKQLINLLIQENLKKT
jgi:hypothetical protein